MVPILVYKGIYFLLFILFSKLIEYLYIFSKHEKNTLQFLVMGKIFLMKWGKMVEVHRSCYYD